MATRTITIDDLDGTENPTVRTRTFMIDGEYYAIDLSDENHTQLRKALAMYQESGQAITRNRSNSIAGEVSPGSAANKTSSDGVTDASGIRAWAMLHGDLLKSRGIAAVSARGALPQAVIDLYNESIAGD